MVVGIKSMKVTEKGQVSVTLDGVSGWPVTLAPEAFIGLFKNQGTIGKFIEDNSDALKQAKVNRLRAALEAAEAEG